ncbi:MAG: hypothetical protein E3K36_11715 [Candidatus Brocadia sp.]|nr:hypothetical protein [Candidatus Brocadia sp.]
MAFTVPYVTNKFTAYPGDVISTNLSLAVRLTDDYTEKEAIGYIKVTLEEGDVKAVRNLSGYYLFNDLAAGNYTVSVESDVYFAEEKVVSVPLPDTRNPVVEIILKPVPPYPFPSNATLVRGLVSNANPVVNADVKVLGKTIETKTDERGEFVLYFKGIKKENITIEINKDGNTKSINTTIEEGKTIFTGIITFP